jgi:hypothetical protein
MGDSGEHNFCKEIIFGSKNTLKEIKNLRLKCLTASIQFPKLETVYVDFLPSDTPLLLEKFFPLLLTSAQCLKTVYFDEYSIYNTDYASEIYEHLIANYGEKFIATWNSEFLDYVPSKYLFEDSSKPFNTISAIEHAKSIEYFSLDMCRVDELMNKFDLKHIFEDILKLPKLKKIGVEYCSPTYQWEDLISANDKDILPELQEIQKLIQNSSIQFVSTEEIYELYEKETKNKFTFELYES